MAKLLRRTPNSFSALLVIFLFSLWPLKNVRSESLSFSFSSFGSEEQFNIGLLGDARPLGGVLQLTRRDGPLLRSHSVGRAVYFSPVHLWDKSTGKLADFNTEFSFVVGTLDRIDHGDGLSFFIIPFDADPRIPKNSTGGFLGLFSPETAFNSYKNQIVAVEFDSFRNDWDPKLPLELAPHIGLDINSLESVTTTEWPIDAVPEGSIGRASISYNSKAKELTVLVSYSSTNPNTIVGFRHAIDLSTVLSEWVRIGFSAATGDKVETHDILTWSFSSTI